MNILDVLKALREQNQKKYELYDSYTGEVFDTYDSRGEANSYKEYLDLAGDWQYRIRTIRTPA